MEGTRTSAPQVHLHVAKDASPETRAALLRMAQLVYEAYLKGELQAANLSAPVAGGGEGNDAQ